MKTSLITTAARGAALLTFVSFGGLQAKDHGNGKGHGKGHAGNAHVEPGHKMVKKALRPDFRVEDRGASAFAPGRSGNPPPGHGGIPPGQLKKEVARSEAVDSYLGIPASRYTLAYGNGYAGRGYYWGPPGFDYFQEAPGVNFYPRQNLVPERYWGDGLTRGLDTEVQSVLSREGYYRGPIDGAIGPGSRAAIARFQADHGLPVTGRVDSALLAALGL
jgi:hypothetical protein